MWVIGNYAEIPTVVGMFLLLLKIRNLWNHEIPAVTGGQLSTALTRPSVTAGISVYNSRYFCIVPMIKGLKNMMAVAYLLLCMAEVII